MTWESSELSEDQKTEEKISKDKKGGTGDQTKRSRQHQLHNTKEHFRENGEQYIEQKRSIKRSLEELNGIPRRTGLTPTRKRVRENSTVITFSPTGATKSK